MNHKRDGMIEEEHVLQQIALPGQLAFLASILLEMTRSLCGRVLC